MSLNDIVNVTITTTGRGIERSSFGIPMVIGYHTNFSPRYKVYSAGTILADLVSDGFTAYDPIYRACAAVARNTPKPLYIVVGRLLSSFSQEGTLEVETSAIETGKVLAFSIVSPDGTATAISYTVQAGDTVTDAALALSTSMTAIADFTASNTLGVIDWAADNAGEMFYFQSVDVEDLTFTDATADSSLATELAQISALYDSWYGLTLADPNSKARVLVLAAAVETQEKIFVTTLPDTACGDATSTTDTAYAIKAAQYFRTIPLYSGDQIGYGAATWLGGRLPYDAGSQTWAYKALPGVTVDSLSTSFITALKGKNCNYYTSIKGLPVTQTGKTAAGEWADIIRGRDWFVMRLRERVFSLLANAQKIPYTDAGIEMIVKEVRAQIADGIARDFISTDTAYTVTAPKAADVSTANKIARLLPDVAFEAPLAGAIHATNISGILTN